MTTKTRLLTFIFFVLNLAPALAQAAGGEKIPVEPLKQKYWVKGDESELRVIQNRLYSKSNKIEFGFFGGTASSDPFVSTRTLGASLAYHINEYLALEAIGWKAFASESAAADELRKQTATNPGGVVAPNVNFQKMFYGGQVRFSPLYGKLSLVGKSIIYFDLHAFIGGGLFNTTNGNYITPYFGLGQQIYLTQTLSLRLDYRMMFYSEDIKNRVTGAALGSRSLTTEAVTLGLTIFAAPFGN